MSRTNDLDIPGAQRVRRKLCSNVQCGVPLFFRERFSIAMEATQDGLWEINLRDNSIFVSRAYFGMLGYEEMNLKKIGVTVIE